MPLPSYVTEALNKQTGPQAGSEYDEFISVAADTHDVDPDLIRAMIDTESGGDKRAVSNKGATGLMQLMPGTAKEMGIEDLTDPFQNIMGGAKYISKLLKANDGDITLALGSYNAGPGNVKKYGGVPPFKETQDYIGKVLGKLNPAGGTEAEAGNFPDYVKEMSGIPNFAKETSGLPDYVKKAVPEKEEDPDWMKWHPTLAGLYGAGKGVLEQALVPSIEAAGTVGGAMLTPFAPIASTALG
jgi:hypothetical protein